MRNYRVAKSLIGDYDRLKSDISSNYGIVQNVSKQYDGLPDSLKELVYNYIPKDDIDTSMALIKALAVKDGGLYVRSEYASQLKGKVVIPEYFNGGKVIKIAEKGFANLANVTEIVVPNSVREIGSAAFAGCNSLRSLTIPFVGNKPNSSDQYGVLGYVFGEKTWTGAISKSHYYGSNYYHYFPPMLTSVTVTNAQTIPYRAFRNCSFLQSVRINGSVNHNFGKEAFDNCVRPVYI